ncbi:hypothetical protein [Micromonospora sp. LOL_023]|uniref:hypothetical protein n=1 Tax=Micromonospora sp. LOL_023 TaxID=3345418 RepID=UPI003A84B5D6
MRQPSRLSVLVLSASALAVFWALAMLTPAGRIAYVYAFFLTDFFGGVFTLVSLSITVMVGLLATDRIVLLPRHRVLLQSAHRTTGIMAIVFLVLHIVTQITTGAVSTVGAFIPFLGGSQAFYVGFGTLAAYLMFAILWTGLARARWADVGPPWMWRAMHSGAYVAWPIGILHGLASGRPPATWVILSYVVCIVLVVIALLVRLATGVGKKKPFVSQATGTSIKPVGKMAEDSRSGSGSSRRRGSRDDRISLEPATAGFGALGGRGDMIDSWAPAGAARGATPRPSDRYRVPEVPQPAERTRSSLAEETRAYRQVDADRVPRVDDSGRGRYAEEDRPAARRYESARSETTDRRWREEQDSGRGRYAEEDTGSRRRYSEESDRRRVADPDDGRRRYADDGRRRYADDDRAYDNRRPVDDTVGSRGRYADDRPVSGSGARSRFADDRPVSGAGPRGRFDDRTEQAEPVRSRAARRRAEAEPPVSSRDLADYPADDTPTLVDLASRRAQRAAAAESAGRRSSRGADDVDEDYWNRLRGEAN